MFIIFNRENFNKNYNYSKQYLFNTVTKVLLKEKPIGIQEIDMTIRALLIISLLFSIYLSYYKRKRFLNKEKAELETRSLLVLEATRMAEEKAMIKNDDYKDLINPHLDDLEAKVIRMETDLYYLRKLCPQMNQRKVTFGSANSTWPILCLSHGDVIIVNYSLVDIINNSTIDTFTSQYTHSGYPIIENEIILPAGTRLIITKATRILRGIRDLAHTIDVTSMAKEYLESSCVRMPR